MLICVRGLGSESVVIRSTFEICYSITNFIVNKPVNTYQCIKVGNCYGHIGHKRKGQEGIKNSTN